MTKNKDVEAIIVEEILNGKLGDASVNCVKFMKPTFVEYIEEKSLTFDYPVFDIYLNQRKSMQGGFISGAFDNVFGILVYLTVKKHEIASVDLDVNYHRPIFEDDQLRVTTYIKSKGKRIVYLVGEAYNKEKKLVATATSKIMILEK